MGTDVEMALFTFYSCDSCKNTGDDFMFGFCNVCKEINSDKNNTQHIQKHSPELNNCIESACMRYSGNSGAVFVMNSLMIEFPQFYTLEPAERISGNFDLILRGDYRCVYCKNQYETFPALKIVRHHLRSCLALRFAALAPSALASQEHYSPESRLSRPTERVI